MVGRDVRFGHARAETSPYFFRVVGGAVPLAGYFLYGGGVGDTPSEVARYLESARNEVWDLG